MNTCKMVLIGLCGFTFIMSSFLRAEQKSDNTPIESPLVEDYELIDINTISAWITNYGSIFREPLNGTSGFEWPQGGGVHAVYASGLWMGALVNNEVRVAVAEYSYEFAPGTINPVTHLPNDPTLPRYRVYKYLTGEIPDSQAIEDGCPPEVIGDQMLYSVYNDGDISYHVNMQTPPLGIEIQQTVFGYLQAGPLGNAVFLRWLIINKGLNILDSTYMSIWSDPDLGDSGDDLVGCDTSLSLGYCYNSTNLDGEYGEDPPAVGYILLQGPLVPSPGDTGIFLGNQVMDYKNLPMTSFVSYINTSDINGNPQAGLEVYNYLKAKWRDGSPITFGGTGINPSSPRTFYMYTGDPESGSGWLDEIAADKRFLMNFGPFNMAPGDSQEVIFGVYILRGWDHLNSVTLLKQAQPILVGIYETVFVALANHKNLITENYVLMQNFPNPFNSQTTIKYQLPYSQAVRLEIFNTSGQKVATLVNERQEPDEYEVVWDASALPSGIYFAWLKVAQYTITKKLLLLK